MSDGLILRRLVATPAMMAEVEQAIRNCLNCRICPMMWSATFQSIRLKALYNRDIEAPVVLFFQRLRIELGVDRVITLSWVNVSEDDLVSLGDPMYEPSPSLFVTTDGLLVTSLPMPPVDEPVLKRVRPSCDVVVKPVHAVYDTIEPLDAVYDTMEPVDVVCDMIEPCNYISYDPVSESLFDALDASFDTVGPCLYPFFCDPVPPVYPVPVKPTVVASSLGQATHPTTVHFFDDFLRAMNTSKMVNARVSDNAGDQPEHTRVHSDAISPIATKQLLIESDSMEQFYEAYMASLKRRSINQ